MICYLPPPAAEEEVPCSLFSGLRALVSGVQRPGSFRFNLSLSPTTFQSAFECVHLPLYLTTPKWSCDPTSLLVWHPFPFISFTPKLQHHPNLLLLCLTFFVNTGLCGYSSQHSSPCRQIQRTHPVLILLELSSICYSWAHPPPNTSLSQHLHLPFCLPFVPSRCLRLLPTFFFLNFWYSLGFYPRYPSSLFFALYSKVISLTLMVEFSIHLQQDFLFPYSGR